jgi:PKD repeat protein
MEMRRMKISSMILCLLMVLGYVAPFVAAPGLIVQTNTSTYQTDDTLTVNISGGASNGIAMIQFNNPSGTPKWAVQGLFSGSGTFTYSLRVPSSWNDGTWTVYVRSSLTTAYATFNISNPAPPTPSANKPPIANAGSAKTAVVGDSVSFDGSASNDPDGILILYTWDFGDGSTGTGATVSHTYTVAGTYTVTLTVKDNLAATGTATTTATIKANQPPVAHAGSSRNIFVGKDITFNGHPSKDPDGTIVSYSWDFGDGSSGSGPLLQHAYSVKGTYTVTLTVTDNKGATGTDSITIKVVELPVPAKGSKDEKITGAKKNVVIDAVSTLGGKVKVNTTNDVNVYMIEYESNPYPDKPLPPNNPGIYLDISVSDPDAVEWPMYVELHYSDADVVGLDETTFAMYYFSSGSWLRCSDTGVDTVNNIVWAWLTQAEAEGSPLTIGKIPAAAQFTLSNLSVSPTQVNVNAAVTVQATVKNIGDIEGSTTVDLLVNGVKEQSKTVTLAGGASTTVSFTVTKSTAGSYTVKVGTLTGSFTVVQPLTPAAFTFSGLVVSPADVAPGTEVTVSVTVKNTGELSGTYSAELKLDGATKETKTGTLAGGASATVTFKASSQAEGTHTVQVGTLTGSFKVTKPVTPPPTAPDYTWYIIGAVAVIVIVVAAYLLMRRKPQGVAP